MILRNVFYFQKWHMHAFLLVIGSTAVQSAKLRLSRSSSEITGGNTATKLLINNHLQTYVHKGSETKLESKKTLNLYPNLVSGYLLTSPSTIIPIVRYGYDKLLQELVFPVISSYQPDRVGESRNETSDTNQTTSTTPPTPTSSSSTTTSPPPPSSSSTSPPPPPSSSPSTTTTPPPPLYRNKVEILSTFIQGMKDGMASTANSTSTTTTPPPGNEEGSEGQGMKPSWDMKNQYIMGASALRMLGLLWCLSMMSNSLLMLTNAMTSTTATPRRRSTRSSSGDFKVEERLQIAKSFEESILHKII